MKIAKRFLAILVVVVLCCSVLSIGASAVEVHTSTYIELTGSSGTYYKVTYSNNTNNVDNGWNNETKQVKVAQALLYRYGCFTNNTTGQIDGIFGNNTYNAIFKYQKQRYAVGVDLGVDGVVGEKTWKDMAYDNAIKYLTPLL